MEASFYELHTENKIRYLLCPSYCIIADAKSGSCRIRLYRGGTLYADLYGEVVSLSVDPIEKKPLYHFYPTHPILSTGPNGCNFRCGFCQNSAISQGKTMTRHVTPEQLAAMASEQ